MNLVPLLLSIDIVGGHNLTKTPASLVYSRDLPILANMLNKKDMYMRGQFALCFKHLEEIFLALAFQALLFNANILKKIQANIKVNST